MPRGQRLPTPAELDAVTLDAYGTLLELRDPVGSLSRLLPELDREQVERAFRAEARHYTANAHRGRDPESLAELYNECVGVFNRELGSSLAAAQYVGALEYEWVEGARDAVERIRARGLAIAVVANWDLTLPDRLAELRVPVVTSAEAGAPKPDPAPFRIALERLGVAAARTLHVGDSEADRDGAVAVGINFAPAPVADVVEAWR